ncbi:hypothetical protein B0F90DRAFT_1721919 [Multifurca ochricompacta]|uniref:DH domain-containing protein n=1 Tax=Multifurca ochricompacta TaxID=376703 RepID=A0AAD4M3R1_9AGAM|nr:hypothetical protein B0F90DRAFT_1721919 [Multifurca ochricompacta]
MAQRNYPYTRRPAQSGVGLGFGSPKGMDNPRSHATRLGARDQARDDVEGEYRFDQGDEDADPLVISPSASSDHLRSLIKKRQTLRSPSLARNVTTTSGPNGSDQRRRELIQLVNEMDNGFSGSTQPYEYDSLSDDEYAGEQGLAISPSDDFDNNADTTLRPRDEHDGHLLALSFVSRHTDGSSLNRLSGTLGRARNQTALVDKKEQEAEFSPLSQYSGDENGLNDMAKSPSSGMNPRSLLTQGGSAFRSTRESDRPLSPRDSSSRAHGANTTSPTSARRPGSGVDGHSGKLRRASRESPAASSPRGSFQVTHSLRGTRSLTRVRERKGTQRSPARVPDIALTHAGSSSSIESLRWYNGEQDISVDAEAIFEQFTAGGQTISEENSPGPSQRPGKGRILPTNHSAKSPAPINTPNLLPQPVADLPESHGTRKAYDGANPIQLPQHDDRSSQAQEPERRTWLSTISSSAYHSLLERYGEVEIKRQQIIWDLCETEKHSVTWLAGVPPEVARLFDWLEDIINIHAQISSALRAIVSEQYPIVMRIAGKVRSFASRLEVHQPYVVRLESTTLLIKRLIGESSSDIGEFIRIQQEQDECQGWTVEAFLVEPVNRLVDYPIYFKRLLDVTPRGHPDYLATFSLLHCTETMIRVMREVKLQEEEYELVKDRLRHIKGLPASLQLAHRSRRLLARGRIEREHPRNKARITANFEALPEHDGSNSTAGVRQSRLISAIQTRAMRSDSIRTTSESANSIMSHFSNDSSTPPYPPEFTQRGASASSSSRQSTWDGQLARGAYPSPGLRGQSGQILYTLVFNDIILLASPDHDTSIRHNPPTQVDSWCLLEGIGISRILKVTEDATQIVLDLLPVDPENVTTGGIPDSGQVIMLTLSIPLTSSSGVRLDASNLSRLRQNWVSAFQECSEHTLRALSFPMQSGKLVAPIPGLVWDNDSQTSVSAILASGLPLPKSPSTQLTEEGADPTQQEREARGWWALRFQQVLREMQRGSAGTLISVPSGTSTSGGGSTADKRHISQPRVLKLSSLSSSESIGNRLP